MIEFGFGCALTMQRNNCFSLPPTLLTTVPSSITSSSESSSCPSPIMCIRGCTTVTHMLPIQVCELFRTTTSQSCYLQELNKGSNPALFLLWKTWSVTIYSVFEWNELDASSERTSTGTYICFRLSMQGQPFEFHDAYQPHNEHSPLTRILRT